MDGRHLSVARSETRGQIRFSTGLLSRRHQLSGCLDLPPELSCYPALFGGRGMTSAAVSRTCSHTQSVTGAVTALTHRTPAESVRVHAGVPGCVGVGGEPGTLGLCRRAPLLPAEQRRLRMWRVRGGWQAGACGGPGEVSVQCWGSWVLGGPGISASAHLWGCDPGAPCRSRGLGGSPQGYLLAVEVLATERTVPPGCTSVRPRHHRAPGRSPWEQRPGRPHPLPALLLKQRAALGGHCRFPGGPFRVEGSRGWGWRGLCPG